MKLKVPALYCVALTIATIAGSCKKDAPSIIDTLSGTYEGSNMQAVSAVRMYTTQGEVKDRELINKFVAKNNTSFTLSATETSADKFKTEVNFSDNGKATVTSGTDDKLSTTEYIVSDKTKKGFVLAKEKSTSVFKSYDNDSIDKILSAANLVDQYSNCNDGNVFHTPICDFTEKLPFVVSQNKLYIPKFALSAFYATYVNGLPTRLKSKTVSNVAGIFNESVIKLLAPGDTLVVQTRLWEFVKKS